jgi:2-polyprenyl-3-methyl-5-hydroxy-6-metoxy-1,4-benzoquinol methylase
LLTYGIATLVQRRHRNKQNSDKNRLVPLHQPQQPQQPQAVRIDEAITKTIASYRDEGRFVLGYVKGKLTHDPVYRQLALHSPLPEPIVDIGCGRGQALILLSLLAKPESSAIGLDWDGQKIERAKRAAERAVAKLHFTVSDVRFAPVPKARTIMLIDVLHYNPTDIQDAMLQRAARALLPGGTLFIRDIDASRGWRSSVNRWQEYVGQWIHFNRGATLCFRPAEELISILKAEGLTVEVNPSWAHLPLANVLLCAHRPQSNSSTHESMTVEEYGSVG